MAQGAASQSSAPVKNFAQDDVNELSETDSAITRILDKTLAQPYIVTVPSEFKYHPLKLHYDFRQSQWDASEQHLEYSSYLYRNTTLDDSLLQLEAQDTLNGTSARGTPVPETNPSTPSLGPKKKVSLADYKRLAKEKGHSSSPAAASASSQASVVAQPRADQTTSKSLAANPITSPGQQLPTDTTKYSSANKGSGFSAADHQSMQNQDATSASRVALQPKQKMPEQLDAPKASEAPKIPPSEGDVPFVPKETSRLNNLRNAAAIPGHVPEIRIESSESPLPDHLSPLTHWVDAPSPTSLQLAAALDANDKKHDELFLDLPSESALEAAKSAKPGASEKGDKDLPSRAAGVARVASKPAASKRASADLDGAAYQERSKRIKASATSLENARTPPPAGEKTKASSTPTPVSSTKQASERERDTKLATPSKHADTPKSSASNGRSSQKWKRELVRLEAAGKQLKRDSQASKGAKDKDSPGEPAKLGLVQGVESILCFMTAFCANDQIKPTHQSWRSLAVLIEEVARRAETHPHLQGLCFLLRWACCQRSVSILNTVKMDELKDLGQATEHLIAVQTYVQRADLFATQANKLLTRDILASTYPHASKASNAIPIASTSPMPVIRTAAALLREWCAHEGVHWTPSFEEGECSRL